MYYTACQCTKVVHAHFSLPAETKAAAHVCCCESISALADVSVSTSPDWPRMPSVKDYGYRFVLEGTLNCMEVSKTVVLIFPG